MALVLVGCGHDEGPSAIGEPFLSATIDGAPWSPDFTTAFIGSEVAVITATRLIDAARSEVLRLELATRAPFRTNTGYVLATLPASFASFDASTSGQTTAHFVTSDDHIGFVTITDADPVDSVVAGRFVFEAEPALGSELLHARGEFRVRYTRRLPANATGTKAMGADASGRIHLLE